ncbi:MAG: transglutaminase family protein [Micavibrio aeruginosavorus]|nr:transglutaminase family protein [Micavibrio aeruginosavorus]
MNQTADPAQLMETLKSIGAQPDEAIDLGRTAIYLAALEQPGLSLERYQSHMQRLAAEVKDRHDALIDAGAQDSAETRLAALKHIVVDKYDYSGDNETYDDLQNASLIRVIDRRRGLPIALGILYIQIGRYLGWAVHGLNIPGHFVCRIDYDAARLIFDPFNGCAVLQAPDLRRLVKQSLGPNAELSTSYYEPADNRTILVRLQNNIKLRRIEAEDYEGALSVVQAMRAIDPEEYRLLLDAGVLCARTNRLQQAIVALEGYIAKAPGDRDRHEAALLLQQIQESLN